MTAPSQHAIVVDDDEAFLSFITFSLAKADFKVTPLSTGAEFRERLRGDQPPNLVLLDRFLPDCDGFELCQTLKQRYPQIPVIMFSTAGDAADVIQGLNLGADDYLPKPFSVDMLMAKVGAVCRRYQPAGQGEEVIRCGSLTINADTLEVSLAGKALALTKTEFQLLLVLTKSQGQIVKTETIMDRVLPHGQGKSAAKGNIAFHINALRKKLGTHRDHIETVRGFGYRFRAII